MNKTLSALICFAILVCAAACSSTGSEEEAPTIVPNKNLWMHGYLGWGDPNDGYLLEVRWEILPDKAPKGYSTYPIFSIVYDISCEGGFVANDQRSTFNPIYDAHISHYHLKTGGNLTEVVMTDSLYFDNVSPDGLGWPCSFIVKKIMGHELDHSFIEWNGSFTFSKENFSDCGLGD